MRDHRLYHTRYTHQDIMTKKRNTYDYLIDRAQENTALLCLIDPDKWDVSEVADIATGYAENGADALLIGGSMMLNNRFTEAVREIKKKVTIPLIIFPGLFHCISAEADALLVISMLSSRNPQVLIQEQVRYAPLVYQAKLETIPTAYLLIESGNLSSVQYMSDSLPIPRKKNDIAIAHALAAQYMGMQMVYLEAGSGAELQVPEEMIKAVKSHIDIPLIVGGGIKSPDDAHKKAKAGADFVVIGTILESQKDFRIIKEFAAAVHNK